MADELVQFLRDRLDEDEGAIEAPESWTEFDETQGTRRVDVDHSIERVVACTRSWRAVHIARHDPARVLADVEAKRRVIADWEDAERTFRVAAEGTLPYDLMTGATNTLRRMLRLLALPYADHPDYRDEWRP